MDRLRPLSDDQKKDPNFDESGLKHELGWINRQETWYDTVLAIRYGKVEIARGLDKPYYRCMGLAVFAPDKQVLPIQVEAYEKEKANCIRAGKALFIREPGTPAAAAAEQYLIDKFEQLVKGQSLGRVNVLKLMDKGKWEGPGRLFDRPDQKGDV